MSSSAYSIANGSIGALVGLGNGCFMSAWNGLGNAPTAQIYNMDGTPKGGSFQFAPASTGENLNFTATTLSDGRSVIVWQQKGEKDSVYARIFGIDGTPVGSAFKIASGSAAQALPQVTALKDGGFVVASIDDGTAVMVKVAADGSQGQPVAIHPNALSVGITELKNGYLAAFVDSGASGSYDMVGYILTPNGDVYKSGEVFSNISDSDPLSPHLAGLSDGRFIVAWDGIIEGHDSINFSPYEGTGIASGDGTGFSAGTGQIVGSPTIAALPQGGFAFAYMQQGASGKDVYAGDSRSGSLFLLFSYTVGDTTSGDQSNPSIAVLNDGRYVVSWTDTLNGATKTYAQMFDARSNAVNWTGTAFDDQYQGTDYGDTLSGSGGNDSIAGGAGRDILSGGSGQDTLDGGDESDVYYVDDSLDLLVDTGLMGTDKVITSIDFTLGSSIEDLTAAGSGALLLAGNSRANAITGNAGNNQIQGGLGNDVLKGGAGKDTFVFNTKLNPKTNVDKITDFSVRDDTVWLDNKYMSKLGKGTELKPGKLNKKFFAVGDKAKDGNDYLIYNKKTGVLSYDADGSGARAAIEIAKLSKSLKLTANDFFVI